MVQAPPPEPQFEAVKPKKPTIAFIWYNCDKVKELQETEKLGYRDAFVRSGEIWKTLSEEQKKPFHDKEAADRIRFEKENKEFRETGFFTNKNGVNSQTLDKVKVKVKKADKFVPQMVPNQAL